MQVIRTSMMDVDEVHEYTYDQLYQVIQATHPTVSNPTESFQYDAVGNRISGAYDHNELNQMLSDDEGYTYEYDSDGNMTAKIDGISGDTTKYTWDIENRLVEVNLTNGDNVKYVYGPLGRRLRKVYNGLVKEYRYDGEDLIVEMGDKDSIVASYTFGPGVDNPLVMHRDNQSFYYVKDGLGSVTALTDSTANVVKEYKYSVFGEMLRETGDTALINPFTYTSREYDKETGNYYYRARYYNPQSGKFFSEDPFGVTAGINLYTYVNNDAVNGKDPLGLFKWHGDWGGPGWTGGQEKPEGGLEPPDFNVNPTDERDACYKGHDVCIWGCQQVTKQSSGNSCQDATRFNENSCVRGCDRQLSSCLKRIPKNKKCYSCVNYQFMVNN